MSAVFHLNNKEAERELEVNHKNKTLPFCSQPKYHASPTLELLRKSWHHTSHSWGGLLVLAVVQWATTLRTAISALVIQTSAFHANLPLYLWVTLNRLRTGVGRFGSNMCQWGLRETGSCICGEENQIAHQFVYHCEALRPPNSLDDLVSPEGVCWLGRLVGIAWGSLLTRKKKPYNSWVLRSCLVTQCSTSLIDPVINDALRTVTGCLRSAPADNLPIPEGTQPAELRRKGAIVSLAYRAIGPWTPTPLSAHLSIERECTASQIKTPICTCRTTAHLKTTEVRRSGRITDGLRSSWTTLRDSVLSSPISAPTLLEWPCLPRTAWVRLNRFLNDVGRFRSFLHKWGMVPSGHTSVAQNRPSIMLSSNVQSIDLPMDCTAWRFRMMGQSNGCSTPAPRSNTAKQWIERTGSNDEK